MDYIESLTSTIWQNRFKYTPGAVTVFAQKFGLTRLEIETIQREMVATTNALKVRSTLVGFGQREHPDKTVLCFTLSLPEIPGLKFVWCYDSTMPLGENKGWEGSYCDDKIVSERGYNTAAEILEEWAKVLEHQYRRLGSTIACIENYRSEAVSAPVIFEV